MHNHYIGEMVSRGVLEEEEGVVRSGLRRRARITPLGRLLLQLVGRDAKPK
jgi:hypothetical protein